MNSKTSIQIILAVIIFIISGIFYYKYFYKQSLDEEKNQKIEILEEEKSKLAGNIIKSINYNSEDKNGNIYLIESEYGEFSGEDENIIFMTKVKAIIKLSDGSIMNLESNNAKYNVSSNDTNFFNNVRLGYLDHSVNADNIDVFFKDGKLAAYSNLVYKNLNLDLFADKVEIDLISKNSKIFMYDNKKIKILKKN
tara:strand:- start:85 stop:669 length:585 start_codon:yes stop_codon:yes gene_type:complete